MGASPYQSKPTPVASGMDSGEGGGGDGGGGEERDADLSLQALSLPLLTLAVIPEQGSSSHTSAMAPAKEPLTLPQQGEEGAEGSQAREGGEQKGGGQHSQEEGACLKHRLRENFGEGYLSGQGKEEGEAHGGVGEASVTGAPPEALSCRGGEEEEKEEEEAISNQSQTKSKCSLLPQQSRHSSSSSTAKASGTLDSKAAASPKPSHPPSPSTQPFPFPPISPKHFSCPSSSSALLSETEVKDIKGDQGWISGFPQSFRSQQSSFPFPLVGTEPVSTPAEEDVLAGVPHSSISTGNGAKAPEPNDSPQETEMDDEKDKDGEQKEAVLKNLNQDLSPGSLTSHMTIMHSRNSCKTLKCPKCNWHYKSQHTLQVHMKEKHPETGGQCVCGVSGGKCVCGGATRGVCGYCSSGKAHPRLARGETYACGYKPYRCEVCDYATSSKGNLSIHMQSDKHLNNVQNGGHTNGHLQTPHISNSSSSNPVDEPPYSKLPLSVPSPTAPPAKLAPPTHSYSHGKRWRCDVCDYETSIARNLRIHTTSEKHTHNMLRLQRGYYLSHCRSLAPHLKQLQNTGAELSLNMRLTSQHVSDQPVTLGSTLTPSPSPSPSPPPAPSLSPTVPLSQGVFQCLVCSCFSSDSLESVEQHLNAPRSLPQSEWCSLVAGGCHCRLCGYTTPLRANFSLHCQTDRHRTRYQLAAHLQEGGDRGQEGAALIAKGNPVQLRCNLCDYVTSSLEKLQGHSLSSHHEASIRVYRFLQQYDGEVDGGSWLFHCLLCNHSSSSKLQVLKHSQTSAHQQREGLLQLQPMGGEELAAIFTIRKSSGGVTGEPVEEMETSSETSTGLLDTTKDKSNMGTKKVAEETEKAKRDEREKRESMLPVKRPSSGCGEMENSISTKRPRTHQQNENQQTVQCPLCQVKLSHTHLRQHLTHVHSVAQDCVDKLISAVTPSKEQQQPPTESELQTDLLTDDVKKTNIIENTNANCSNAENCNASTESQTNKVISVENTEGDITAPKDVTSLLTPPLEDNTIHPSNGTLAPQSPTQIPPSSPPTSPPSDPPPLSDRHGYRFRCSRCSLAFPTQEKLQLHWQYHAMRAATECPLCSRQCRSQEALQRHMQNTHSQQDGTQGQITLFLPNTVQCMDHNKNSVQQEFSLSPQVGQEAGEGDDEDIDDETLDMEECEEQKENYLKDKEEVSEVDGEEEAVNEQEKGAHEEIASEPSSSSLVKKSLNPTMDRYLDPSRPYKCTICSESFTQKTILLVHYNSVSHLHRARRALQDSGANVTAQETPRAQDPRPYRCRLCGVGYSQSSTLDIHLRSVLHQTRARAAQNSAPQTSAATVVAPVSVHAAAVQAPTTKEATKKPNGVGFSATSLVGTGLLADSQPTLPDSIDSQQAKKRVAELLASRNQLMLIQQQQLAQAQVQAQLQQQTALLQSQAIQHLSLGTENLLKQHFSLLPDNLLSLQQQLFLPFYLSGDMKLNSELTVKSPNLGQSISTNSFPKDQNKAEAKREFLTDDKQIQKQSSNSVFWQPPGHSQSEAKVETVCSGSSNKQMDIEPSTSGLVHEKEEMHVHTVKTESQKEDTVSSSFNVLESQCPPPRVPYAAANGEPLRALLQSYGYELAMQYIQSRHRHQQQKAMQMIPSNNTGSTEICPEKEKDESNQLQIKKLEECDSIDKRVESDDAVGKKHCKEETSMLKEKICCEMGEKCKNCGKFFSDALILKSHQEYIHSMTFPTAALEIFSREYRLQYDQMYPLGQHKSGENSTQASAPNSGICTEPEPKTELVKPQAKTPESSPVLSVSDPTTKENATAKDLTKPAPTASSPSSPSQTQDSQQHDETIPGTSATSTTQTTTPIPLPLPKIPMLPLSLSQLPIPPLPIPKLPLPPISFPMEVPLLPPVVMQSMALQTQPWLDSSVNPDVAKLYQSQLNSAVLGQQSQLNPALLAQQSQLSPALLGQPPQISPALLGQPSQPSPIQTGQQSQVSPTTTEQQGKRTRTRISEDQLSVLRKHFDINSLPSDEEINKMSALSGLPHKVIKHWFRNTLFKERQRDKDSPYNFNNPPTTALEESREELAQNLCVTHSPCSLSPGLSINTSPQTSDLHRGEAQRGRRSSRTRFTEQQLETLQGVFEATPYPREEEYDRLSALLSLPNRVIVVWFQNARQRARKNQDRGTDDGLEGKNQPDNSHSQKNGCFNNDANKKDNGYRDEGQDDSQNENSMDFTYEYYNLPDSPVVDSSTHSSEGEHLTTEGEQIVTVVNKEDKTISIHANMSPPPVNTPNRISDAEIQKKEIAPVMKTGSSPQPDPKLPSESPTERPQPLATSFSEKTIQPNMSMSHLDQGNTQSPPYDQALEKTVSTSPTPPSAPDTEPSHNRMLDTTACLSTETQPHLQSQAQFQCSLCPVSLPSIQAWQEHQTRHLLAAQSQVQFLQSGFADRTMPYMMLHPNHSLMASQMLSGAMSQMHPNPTHSMISHLNSLQIKNTFSDHPGNTLNSSMTSLKHNTKHISETSFESQRGNREVEEEHRRDKRQRTTITPEQLEVLYQRYSLDSNPTRGVLESIARDVGLTRRVVQVWFQNTRARERKGQFRSMGPGSSFTLGLNHLRCPFCRALFKVKSALDAHLRSRHWAEAERAGYNLSIGNGYSGQAGLARSFVTEGPGPSVSSNQTPNPGFDNTKKETQMSHFQVLQLKAYYRNHRTPNRLECETLGQELGLPHRVVQVWFQNARAKEKRAKSLSSESAEREQAELSAGAGERDRA
ncbi:unnamed protein product [Menidia menidia]|uniref:(Atlantic silverside) hypothetical protein n=1 Tax=Menidia menidia TaxID=238744 RepID=A0A8S4BAP2_9TELE|nr:unnamed protein product [Menidia menidia]